MLFSGHIKRFVTLATPRVSPCTLSGLLLPTFRRSSPHVNCQVMEGWVVGSGNEANLLLTLINHQAREYTVASTHKISTQ